MGSDRRIAAAHASNSCTSSPTAEGRLLCDARSAQSPSYLETFIFCESREELISALIALAIRAAAHAFSSASDSASFSRSASARDTSSASASARFSRAVSSQTTAAAYKSVSKVSFKLSIANALARAIRVSSIKASMASSRPRTWGVDTAPCCGKDTAPRCLCVA